MSKIGRDEKDVIIIDNTPSCYRLQKTNAIPILSWFDDKSDKELSKLLPLLRRLAKVDDVRPYLKKMIKGEKVSFEKMSKVFKDEYEPSSKTKARRSQSIMESNRPNLRSPVKEIEIKRDYSQSKRHHKINSQYGPTPCAVKEPEDIENSQDHNKMFFKNPTPQYSTAVKKSKSAKEKTKIKNSFVNIDNIQKRIYPKTKKYSKKTKDLKKQKKEKNMSQKRQKNTIDSDYYREKSKLAYFIAIAPVRDPIVPRFDLNERVATYRQDEASQLASYAHNLRRSYIRSGNQDEQEKHNNVVSEATKYYGRSNTYRVPYFN